MVQVERHIYPLTVVSSPCQSQCELLPSLGARRLSSVYFSHRTRGEHANHYATDAVPYFFYFFFIVLQYII
jgi:hypothetical protein